MGLKYEKKQHYAIMTLNRPEALNALDPETMQELYETFEDFNNDNDMRAVILTGSGDRSFCTGADLKKTIPTAGDESFVVGYLQKTTHFIDSMKSMKPIICAINGYAIGGGLELALACDIRIASKNASFGLSEVKIASIPGAGGTQRLTRAVPQAIAMKMLLTGERIDSEEAYRIGLISDLVEWDQLLPYAEKVAQSICENGPLAVRAVKKVVTEGNDMNLEQGLMLERLMWGSLRDTEDRIEGRRAFGEKRKPQYKGK
jgi:E-phenylitaconyl-CoA hydratase